MSQSSSDLDARIQSGELRVLWVKDFEYSEPVDQHWSESLDGDGFGPEVGDLVRSLGDRLSDLKLRCWYEESQIFMNNVGLENYLFEQLAESQASSSIEDDQCARNLLAATAARHGGGWHRVAIPRYADDTDDVSGITLAAADALVVPASSVGEIVGVLESLIDAAEAPDPRSDGTTICEVCSVSGWTWNYELNGFVTVVNEFSSSLERTPELAGRLRSALKKRGLDEWHGRILATHASNSGVLELFYAFPGVRGYTDYGTDTLGRCPVSRNYIESTHEAETTALIERLCHAMEVALGHIEDED